MSKIEQQVMASVAVIYTARKLLSFQALLWYVLILSIFGISQLVSVPHVLQNFSLVARGGFPSILAFLGAAVQGTTLAHRPAWSSCCNFCARLFTRQLRQRYLLQ
jgi:uncharacterized integral membrane protein